MSSREETIKYLEESIRDFKPFCNQEDRKRMNVYAALDSLYATLDLLKEQKGEYKCSNCGVLLHKQDEYCPFCGKKVKWVSVKDRLPDECTRCVGKDYCSKYEEYQEEREEEDD